ncbi:MAG: hypothetical protein ACI9OJ_003491, partial [Myxococcota bacterium]
MHDPELWKKFLALRAPVQRVIELAAASNGTLDKIELVRATKYLPRSQIGGPMSATRVNSALAVGQKTGLLGIHSHKVLVAPGIAELVCRRLVRDARFGDMATAIDTVDPLDVNSFSYMNTAWRIEREMRRAVYAGQLRRLLKLTESWSRTQGPTDSPKVLSWVANPLESDLIESLPADMGGFLLTELADHAFGTSVEIPGLDALIERIEPRGCNDVRVLKARPGLMRGDSAESLEFRESTVIAGQMSAGLALLMRGDLKAAASVYDNAHKRWTNVNGPRAALYTAEGLFAPLALALGGNKGQSSRARSIVKLAWLEGPRRLDLLPWCDLGPAYTRLFAWLDNKVPASPSPRILPLASLVDALVTRWSDETPNAEAVGAAAARAIVSGHGWLSAELKATLDEDPAAALPNTVALFTHRTARPEWERVLEQLEQALGGPAKTKPTGPTHRIVWQVTWNKQDIDLEARLQKKSRNGWTKGRKVSPTKLSTTASTIEGMTHADLAVAACLRANAATRWDPYAHGHKWDTQATWRALIGHPAVYEPDSDEPLEIVARTPRAVIDKTRRAVKVTIVPNHESNSVVTELAAGRLEVSLFDPEQARLAELIGKGLSLPVAATKRLAPLLTRLADVFEIHDNAKVSTAKRTDADASLYARIRPLGDGIHAALVVCPLGFEGPGFFPGDGPNAMLGRVGGKAVNVTRDLEAESKAAVALGAKHPALAELAYAPGGYDQSDLYEALEFLQAVQLADEITAQWPDGESLRVRSTEKTAFHINVSGT